MSLFAERVAEFAPTGKEVAARKWFYIAYDRLTDQAGPLRDTCAEQAGIIMVEAQAKARRRPYHKKKLALLLANERHFALEQGARGVKVIYVFTHAGFAEGLLAAQKKHDLPEITLTRPAEREMRLDMEAAVAAGARIREIPDPFWLSTFAEFQQIFGPSKSFVMDHFYRAMRQKTGILMENGKPIGGKYSFDEENRQPFRHQVAVPVRARYEPDCLTREVLDVVEREFPGHFGELEGFGLPVTAVQCQAAWRFALEELLPFFGPFEDAMNTHDPDLFHSRISALVNLGRLVPAQIIREVADAHEAGRIPIASAEGFIRQVLGWREFMRHVHESTDGFRKVDVPQEKRTEGGKKANPTDPYAGATPSALGANKPLPAAYWGVPSGLNCLDTVVAGVVRNGWSHHITRLMVLSNLATLCGFSPRELTDWFWFAYVDAYDWVVEPNVLGMSSYADGGLTATKPYVSGAAYINRMSDFCANCRYDPKKALGEDSCPFTSLYWTFLERNAEVLSDNQRLKMPYVALARKSAAERYALRVRAEAAIAALESVPRPDYSSKSGW